MRWPWRRENSPVKTKRMTNPRAMELETAKEILAEVFQARPTDVEEMIQRRLEERERDWDKEEKLWPATFRLGE